ncbi:unnamed protein product [Lepeophtheirus salmonis]|uniref:(salmon louse) hypothetical protein n=1 Tax=Lepeophtheirus salmonis TaxID=72036 RepID=A0A7R8H591_LEPSM|nr:unnamed protein product [Lepeophtheirus salmonis]CAF2863335.1 unnamed protein product [Lepeophtheirus salmonis]
MGSSPTAWEPLQWGPLSNKSAIALKEERKEPVFSFLLTPQNLSRNKLNEVPDECTKFSSMEKFLLYHNTIKSIPDSIIALHSLQFLDLSRNQLSYLPANLCQLPLQGLIVNNNRLVSFT